MAKTYVCRNHKKPLFAYVTDGIDYQPICHDCKTLMEETDERQATWL